MRLKERGSTESSADRKGRVEKRMDQAIEKGLVSVVMSNYNTPETYLRAAIDSVLSQTYTNFEFIIVDDGSTDNSADIIESYMDPRIRLIRNEKNMGITASLNKALNICRGEYTARMDSDDICYPQRFEKQLAYMREHPDVIACGTNFELIDKNGDLKPERWDYKIFSDMEVYRIYLLFANRPAIIHPTVMLDRKLLLKYNIRYNESYVYAQDYRLWISCARHAVCCCIPDVLLKYRVHGLAVSSKKRAMQDDCLYRIIQEQLDELHLKLNDEVKPLHREFLYTRHPLSIRLIRWLNSIISANKKYRVYNQKKLKKLIMRRLLTNFKYNLLDRIKK